ncbi:MaoC family dehydratase [Verminephrobacter eiseniae]|uniref:MaoC family dehydratase n=1 Tax=Verminephrobacter eiseniae TaxID=364317 RepID=UPI002238868E|nr:MaoC family dehydratase [Verminephrobacter eiseniae]MCW5238360.1 dehydratase [Verminephrobacter eiseniae]
MATPALQDMQVGDSIPALQLPAISRTTLALYAGASGDHNPIHIDIDFARSAGLDDVFAHGMLSAAYVGRLVTDWAGQQRLRRLHLRFTGITRVHDAPLCTGRVVERFTHDGELRLRLQLQCVNQKGDVKILGEAVVAAL